VIGSVVSNCCDCSFCVKSLLHYSCNSS
jgi:hypothetical protein